MTAYADYLIAGHFMTKELLSHIGESESTRSFLNETPVKQIQPDGSHVMLDVFQYNGNAWRGQLRDMAADYMVRHLGLQGMELQAFNMLYSGGAFTEGTSVPIAKIRNMRHLVPMLAMFSSGETRESKMSIGSIIPVCEETASLLDHATPEMYAGLSYRDIRTEISHTRRDDAKDPEKSRSIRDADLMLDGAGGAAKKPKVSTQMRTTFEALAKGVHLESEIWLDYVSEIELGCLVSALDQFSHKPKIGGKVRSGFGKVSLAYNITDMATGESQPFVRIGEGGITLEPDAHRALTAYTDHLESVYSENLTENSGSIRALLAGAA